MGSDAGVGVGEQGAFDGEGGALADLSSVEVFVCEGDEEALDDAVGLRAAPAGADVPEQRVVAGEGPLEGLAAEAGSVVGDDGDGGGHGPQVGAVVVEQLDAAAVRA